MKKSYIIVIVALLLIIVTGLLLVFRNGEKNTSIEEATSIESADIASQEPSEAYKEGNEVELNNDDSVRVTISSADFLATGDLLVKTQLYGIASGECNLKITTNGTTIEKLADIIFAPEFSSCEGYLVSRDEVQNNDVVLSLTVNSNNKSYYSESHVVKK